MVLCSCHGICLFRIMRAVTFPFTGGVASQKGGTEIFGLGGRCRQLRSLGDRPNIKMGIGIERLGPIHRGTHLPVTRGVEVGSPGPVIPTVIGVTFIGKEGPVRRHAPSLPEMRRLRRFFGVRVGLRVWRLLGIAVPDILDGANFLNNIAIPAVGLPLDGPGKLAPRLRFFLYYRIVFDRDRRIDDIRRKCWA